jgi:LruC domain-containing protein
VKNSVRGQEIHLPNYLPTDLADPTLFGTGDDDTTPGLNKYYKSKNNLPWAIDVYGKFNYPTETSDVSKAYLHFGAWAESNGSTYQDWWLNTNSGYRDTNLIY